VDLNGISTQDLITGIAEPFVSSITTDYYLSNRSRSLWDGNQSSPAEEEEKNTYLLPFQLNRYQHTFRRYDYLLHKQGNTAFGNERTAWASGIATTIINETVGEGDPRVNYTRPTPKAEILQAYCPAIAGELTRRYLRATDPAEKQQIKEASMRFAKTITDSVMIDGKTSFQQDETAFHLLIPIITDDLQLTAQIQAVKPEDIRADLAKECELPVARTASLAQLSQSLPEGKQELFKRYLTEYTTFSDMDLSLTALPCGDLIMLSSLWYTIKTDKQWSEQKFKAEIEKNMNIMTNHTQIVFPDPKPVSIQLFESVCDRLEAR